MRWSTLADGALAALVGVAGVATLAPLAVAIRLRRRGTSQQSRRILYLGTGQIAQVFPRNGASLFLERECSDFAGYFEQMWNVHYPAGARGHLDLDARHHLVDFDVALPGWLSRHRRAAMVLRQLIFLGWLWRTVDRLGVSVVTATNPYLQGLNAALTSRALGVPYAVMITRDYDWDWEVLGKQAFPSIFPSRAVEKAVEQWVLSCADLVLADRAYYRDYALRNGARPLNAVSSRVVVESTYERVTLPSAAARDRWQVGHGPLLVYVGRLDPDKLALELIEVLIRVRQRFSTVVLACAGSGTLAQAMMDRAADAGVADGLRLLGPLGQKDLMDLLAAADVVVGANMGYVLVEAGLSGAPIATYAYDWHEEVVRSGDTGLLAPLHDTHALADRVCRLLVDPAEAVRLGARARRYLLQHHNLASVQADYRAAYGRILSSAPRR